jgi:hypothetical protein
MAARIALPPGYVSSGANPKEAAMGELMVLGGEA